MAKILHGVEEGLIIESGLVGDVSDIDNFLQDEDGAIITDQDFEPIELE